MGARSGSEGQRDASDPVLFQTFLYSTVGAGLILRPTESVQFTHTAASPGGTANSAGFNTSFKEGIKPFGPPGHRLFGGIWGPQIFTSLAQDPRHAILVGSIISCR
jgi:hypothetical protein